MAEDQMNTAETAEEKKALIGMITQRDILTTSLWAALEEVLGISALAQEVNSSVYEIYGPDKSLPGINADPEGWTIRCLDEWKIVLKRKIATLQTPAQS